LGAIDLEVDGDELRVEFDRGCPPEVIANVAVLRDGRFIEEFGSSALKGAPLPNARYRVEKPFDAEAFNPDLAEAVTRHLAAICANGPSAWHRELFRRQTVRLRWVSWSRLPSEHRTSYLRSVAVVADVEVNGTIAVRGSLLRSLFAMGPSIQRWAVE